MQAKVSSLTTIWVVGRSLNPSKAILSTGFKDVYLHILRGFVLTPDRSRHVRIFRGGSHGERRPIDPRNLRRGLWYFAKDSFRRHEGDADMSDSVFKNFPSFASLGSSTPSSPFEIKWWMNGQSGHGAD